MGCVVLILKVKVIGAVEWKGLACETRYMVGIWRVYGGYMVGIIMLEWWVYGGYMLEWVLYILEWWVYIWWVYVGMVVLVGVVNR